MLTMVQKDIHTDSERHTHRTGELKTWMTISGAGTMLCHHGY